MEPEDSCELRDFVSDHPKGYPPEGGYKKLGAKWGGERPSILAFVGKLLLFRHPLRQPKVIKELPYVLLRLGMAVVCETAIVAPMVIMSLNKSLKKSLITTAVSVALVAMLLSILPVKRSDMFIGTATYAAVLMVFVGVSS